MFTVLWQVAPRLPAAGWLVEWLAVLCPGECETWLCHVVQDWLRSDLEQLAVIVASGWFGGRGRSVFEVGLFF